MISNNEYCSELVERIKAAYEISGNKRGWRLLASPKPVLDKADVAFIGLNPGGSIQPAGHAEFAMQSGSAYAVETWGKSTEPGTSPLQIQVQALFEKLRVHPDQVLAGNLVPFRSPSWKRLENRSYSIHFGEMLWADILTRAQPSLVIGMGKEILLPLSRILCASNQQSIPVNWGNVSAIKASFSGGSLVVLPHLSRFGIVTRAASADALRAVFGEHWHA